MLSLNLDTDEVTNAISTIEDVADQLNKMMAGEDIEKTSFRRKAIERYTLCDNLPDTINPRFTLYDGQKFGDCDSEY